MAARKTSPKKRTYKSKGPKKPNRAELECHEIETKILEFWKELSECRTRTYRNPWVLNVIHAENAGSYLVDGKRKPYQGSVNQWIIAHATRDSDSALARLALTQAQICKLFGVDKYPETPVCEAGVRSKYAVFTPNMRSRYVHPSGELWNAPDGAYRGPTQQEITQDQLTRRQVITGYGSSACYSMEDVYPHLPADVKLKVDALLELRTGAGRTINPDDSFENLVSDYVDDMVKRQGVHVESHQNQAAYDPGKDIMLMPSNRQFTNPLEYLAISAHELGHSTMHLNGRKPIRKGEVMRYAIEEVIAETTSAMVVMQFEENLPEEFKNRPDVKAMFDDYYQRSHEYVRDYGNKTQFLAMVRKIESVHEQEVADTKSKTKTVRTIMRHVAGAVATLNRDVSPEERLEAKNASMDRLRREALKEIVEENAPA